MSTKRCGSANISQDNRDNDSKDDPDDYAMKLENIVLKEAQELGSAVPPGLVKESAGDSGAEGHLTNIAQVCPLHSKRYKIEGDLRKDAAESGFAPLDANPSGMQCVEELCLVHHD